MEGNVDMLPPSGCLQCNHSQPRFVTHLLRFQATKRHIDEDKSGCMNFDEYKELHRRLVHAFTQDDEDDNDMTDEEIHQSLHEDWSADASGDDSVTKNEFFNAIFQLADGWCDTVDVEEYVQYLEHLYAKVFGGADKWKKLHLYKFGATAYKAFKGRSGNGQLVDGEI